MGWRSGGAAWEEAEESLRPPVWIRASRPGKYHKNYLAQSSSTQWEKCTVVPEFTVWTGRHGRLCGVIQVSTRPGSGSLIPSALGSITTLGISPGASHRGRESWEMASRRQKSRDFNFKRLG